MNLCWNEMIKFLRKKHKITQKQAADILAMQLTVYRRYETGERLIPIDKLIMVADYYNVSTDYVLGRTDDSTPFR